MRAHPIAIRILVAGAILAIVALLSRSIGAPVIWSGARALQVPLAAWSVRLHGRSAAIRSALGTPDRAAALEQQLTARDAVIAARDATIAELRAALALARVDLAPHRTGDPIIARVLAASFANGSAALTVDRGSNDRVAIGDPAVVRGALVGIVQSVNASAARIRLLSDAGTRIDVARATTGGTVGILGADPGGGIVVTHIPTDVEFAVGDTITTGPIAITVPAGIPIGRIGALQAESDGFFRRAAVDLLVDPARELFMTVLRQSGDGAPA